MAVQIEREDPRQPEVKALLAQSDAYHAALYPAESNHLVDAAALRAPEVAFFVSRLEGVAVGTASLVAKDAAWGEVKRMYVAEAARGRSIGRRLLAALEDAARAQGLALLRLETGVRQPEAVGLYRAAGYRERAAFGDYAAAPDPLSIYMEKRLADGGAAG